jgi:hypothetical protein
MVSPLTRLLRLISIAICVIVAASFLVFAVNQTKTASHRQREVLGETAAAQGVSTGKTTQTENPVHQALEDTASTLTSPFAGVASSGGEWTDRGVRLLLTLLVYGFGIGFLVRAIRVRA